MSIAETDAVLPASDFGFLAGLIPNRDRGRFLRAAVLLFLAFSSVGYSLLLAELCTEYQARHNWPVARGEVVSCEEKTGEGASIRRTRYWMECEVRFDVPVAQCLTGTTAADTRDRYPCYGIVHSPSTSSWGVTNGWTNSQFLSTPNEFFTTPMGRTSNSRMNLLGSHIAYLLLS
jgi:hypothetical protein